jgi:hypothetical protein
MPVLTVPGTVCRAPSPATSANRSSGRAPHSSRMRSNATTESFTEYPMIVSSAARNTPSTGLPSQAKTPVTMTTSWNIASTAPAANVQRNRVLQIAPLRIYRWLERREADQLADRKPGAAVHGLLDVEIEQIIELFHQWGEIDRSHRKLAPRGSYLERVWVSPRRSSGCWPRTGCSCGARRDRPLHAAAAAGLGGIPAPPDLDLRYDALQRVRHGSPGDH